MKQDALYFEDLKVGDTFVSPVHEVRSEDIVRFATEFDPQAFHLDPEAGRTSLFGGLAASGWHTAAISMRLLLAGGPKLANGVIGTRGEIEWKVPTRPGDLLQVHSQVVELTGSGSRADRGSLLLRSKTVNQRGDVVQTFTARLIVARRVPTAGEHGTHV